MKANRQFWWLRKVKPAYIEDAMAAILYRARSNVQLSGKDVLPMAGEYIGPHILEGVTAFLARYAPEETAPRDRAVTEQTHR